LLDYIVKGSTADVLAKAEEVANKVSANAAMGVWGLIRVRSLELVYHDQQLIYPLQSNLYCDALKTIQKDIRLVNPLIDDAAARSRL